MADYKTPQWLLPNEKNLAYPAAGDGITGSGLSEDRHSLYSMDFDGTTNQNINLPTNWVTSLGLSTEMSFSVWVKPDSTSTQMNITSSPYNTWNDNFGIKYIAGSTTLTLEQGSTIKFTNTSTTLSTTSYTHICFVLDAGESSASTKVKCYINGTVVTNENTTSSFTTMVDKSYNFYIGRLYYGAGSSNYTWNGQIDEIAIWNKALNQSEINALSVADAPANIMALNEKPIAYYPLGEQAQMGSANWSFPNGSLQSHVVDFDGSGDEINCGSISQTNEGDISFSAWCNVTATGTYQSILSSTDTSGKAGINIIIRNDGKIKFERNQDISNTRNNTGYNAQGFSFGNWNHLCGTFNSTTGELKAYVNGDLQVTSSNTSAGASPTDDLHIGILSDSTNYPANGEISNVVIWNSDQSANIDNIYNNGSPQSTYTATPNNWWKLNAADSSYNTATSTWTFTDGPGTNDGTSTTLPSTALVASDLQFESPYSNYSLSFDGATNYLDCGNIPALQNASVITWNLWVNFNSANYNIVFGKDLVGTTDVIQFYTWASGVGYFFLKTAGTSVTASISSFIGGLVNTGDWNMFTIVFDGSETGNDRLKIYLNGGASNIITGYSGTVPATLPNTTDEFYIGKGLNGDFDGKMDEFSIFNKVLTFDLLIFLTTGVIPITFSPTSTGTSATSSTIMFTPRLTTSCCS